MSHSFTKKLRQQRFFLLIDAADSPVGPKALAMAMPPPSNSSRSKGILRTDSQVTSRSPGRSPVGIRKARMARELDEQGYQ